MSVIEKCCGEFTKIKGELNIMWKDMWLFLGDFSLLLTVPDIESMKRENYSPAYHISAEARFFENKISAV